MVAEFDLGCQFMGAWFISEDACDGLISYYEEHPNKTPGYINNMAGEQMLRPEVKISTEVYFDFFEEDPRIQAYVSQLSQCFGKYREAYPAVDASIARWGFTEPVNIQRYRPGEGFFAWHTERNSPGSNARVFVFMTYLNDVTDGGQTEWKHQELSVSPRKGLTVIWPAEWMFLHRGVPSPTQEKTIATGWMSFMGHN
jgi:hypothetical protein